jgi:hypothetical protein
LFCREAGVYWNQKTTDNFASMRPKINADLAAVAEEYKSGGLTWSERHVERLIMPYPPRHAVDRVLKNLGEDFYHDDIHGLKNKRDDTVVADGNEEASEASSDNDKSDGDGEPAAHVLAAVAGEGVEGAESAELEGSPLASDLLSAGDADAVHKVRSTIAVLQATIEGLRAVGSVRGVQ